MSEHTAAATRSCRVYLRAAELIDVIETEVFAIHCHPQIMDEALAAIVAAKQELKLALADAGVEVDV